MRDQRRWGGGGVGGGWRSCAKWVFRSKQAGVRAEISSSKIGSLSLWLICSLGLRSSIVAQLCVHNQASRVIILMNRSEARHKL